MKFFLYLHGFGGSPNSDAAKIIKKNILDNNKNDNIKFIAPDLKGFSIYQTFEKLENIITPNIQEEIYYIGFSIGGFMAVQMHKKHPGKVILLNPCLNPSKYIDKHISTKYINPDTNISHEITPETKKLLQDLEKTQIPNQNNILLLTQKDDESINYQDAINIIPNSKQIIISGGGHQFTNIEKVIPDIINFCGFNN